MLSYLDLLHKILSEGNRKENRTGISTISMSGAMFEHDMAKGFPLLTTKKMGLKNIATELEFFIKGITDKDWLKRRKCNIWNEWCSPDIVQYSHDNRVRERMAAERELGPIYGWQWRNFGGTYIDYKTKCTDGFDQLAWAVNELDVNPSNRRVIVSAWNPIDIPRMALPPCHYSFQILINNEKLDLIWQQRSCDTILGIPYNIASYALLLKLIAAQLGREEGKLIGQLGDVHIYSNHHDGMKKQLDRTPYPSPQVTLDNFTNIFDWKYTDFTLHNYISHPAIRFEVAI